jgi:hypothetical protein
MTPIGEILSLFAEGEVTIEEAEEQILAAAEIIEAGMLDVFAVGAMRGLLSNGQRLSDIETAQRCYEIAQAMMVAREGFINKGESTDESQPI